MKNCSNCKNHTWGDEWWNCTPECHGCRYTKEQGEEVPSNWKPLPMTNADRIRAMSDDELRDFLFNEVSVDSICNFCVPKMRTERTCDGHCKNGVLEWLKQPAEDATNENISNPQSGDAHKN